MTLPRLIGMVHLGPLPGSPGFAGDLDTVVAAAVSDAAALESAGFEALMVENFGDAPFFADDVPKATVAAMTAAVGAVASASALPIGVNVLRNDVMAALAIAAATGATMVRVNVLSGMMYTDQGPIVGRAAEASRLRAAIAPTTAILADVLVKHASPPPGLTPEGAARDTLARAGADAVVVSGTSTGAKPSLSDLRSVATAAGTAPVFVGSGATAATIGELLSIAHGVIVGTAVKRRGVTTEPVDPDRAAAVVDAYRAVRGEP